MDIWSFWKRAIVLIALCEISTAEKDILEVYRPKLDNPPELNEFLTNVREHSNDFRFVKQAAESYRNIRRIEDQEVPSTNSLRDRDYYAPETDSAYETKHEDKRHAYSIRHPYKKFRKFANRPYQQTKNRYRRQITQNNRDSIVVDPRSSNGEILVYGDKYPNFYKKEIVGDETKMVDRSNYNAERSMREDYNNDSPMHGEIPNDDPESGEERNFVRQEFEKEPYEPIDSIQPKDNPADVDFSSNNPNGNNLYSVDAGQTDKVEGFNGQYPDSSLVGNFNPQETESRLNYLGPSNNPMPQSDTVVNINPQKNLEPPAMQVHSDYSSPVRNNPMPQPETVNINPSRTGPCVKSPSMEQMHSGSEGFSRSLSNMPSNLADDVGKGFIEIYKAAGDSIDNYDTSLRTNKREDYDRYVAKKQIRQQKMNTYENRHKFNPLRMRKHSQTNNFNRDDPSRFTSRHLSFVDEGMINNNFNNEETEYDTWPRPRRDFLDALGMKNEEDYTEDDPYSAIEKENNTSIANDTHIGKNNLEESTSNVLNTNSDSATTCNASEEETTTTGTPACVNQTSTPTTTLSQKQDVDRIQKILEEPKQVSSESTGSEKREKKEAFSEVRDFDGIVEPDEPRRARDLSRQLSDKIWLHKNRITGHRKKKRQKGYRNETPRRLKYRDKRRRHILPKMYYLKPMYHRIHKKEDFEIETPSTGVPSSTHVANTTDSYTMRSTIKGNNNISYEKAAQLIDEENEKLAQVANGHIASHIVDTVFEQLKKKSTLRAKFYAGLSRKHVDFKTGALEFDIFSGNQTQKEVMEAKLMLEQVTNVLNRLVASQVRRKLCQRLPDDLRQFLNLIVHTKNVVDTEAFAPNENQGNFLFDSYLDQAQPPGLDIKKLQETLVALEGLLLNFHKMSGECQNRALPVKDYIEDHVGVLRRIISCPNHSCDKKRYAVNNDGPRYYHDSSAELVEKQLESLGLGRRHHFVPNFDLDKIVRSRMGDESSAIKFPTKREVTNRVVAKTEKFKKLQKAVEEVREKRENDQRIGELYGAKGTTENKFDVNFENPLVYNL